jgi:hypothetical protein
LLLFIGEDGHQLALHFFFQVRNLLSLLARQVKLSLERRGDQGPATVRAPRTNLTSGSIIIGPSLGRARWLLVIVARALIVVGRRRRLPIIPAPIGRLAVCGIYRSRLLADHSAGDCPGKDGQTDTQRQPGHHQFSNFAALHGLTPCQSCRRSHALCARVPRGVRKSTRTHLKA